jgi:hypothetical protein
MHAHAEKPAVADADRADSPIDMHRNDAHSDAQQSGSCESQADTSGAVSSTSQAAAVQQAAQLMGRRLKVSNLVTCM